MSYLLNYVKSNGTLVEALRPTYDQAVSEATYQQEHGSKAIICYEIKEGIKTRSFWLMEYRVCYQDRNGRYGIIRGTKWSYNHQDLGQKMMDAMKKGGFKRAVYYEQPFPLILKRVQRRVDLDKREKTAIESTFKTGWQLDD